MTARCELLVRIAALIPRRHVDCVLVGIDGVDGAGKTIFADELAAVLATRAVVRVSVDDFHHVRAVRYRRGRDSPLGLWLHSFDYSRLTADVLDPLGRDGSRRYRPIAHDLDTDRKLEPPWQTAALGSVVIVDGLFLHRPELAGRWDLSVFLDVPFEVTAQRMLERDGPPAPGHERYVEAARLYLARCDPEEIATVVVDNTDYVFPRLVKPER